MKKIWILAGIILLCPSGTHQYFFKLYALDAVLDLESGSTKTQLEPAMSGHIIEKAQLNWYIQ